MQIIVVSAAGRPSFFLPADCNQRAIAGAVLVRYGAQLSEDGQTCVPHSWIARL